MRRFFISDVHLCLERPGVVDRFERFIEHCVGEADQLYILGDLFEFWIGDDYRTKLDERVARALSRLSVSGCRLFFQHGNRDFLIGEEYAQRCEFTLLDEVHRLDIVGDERALLMHGDLLCLADRDYQQFRRWLRKPESRVELLSKSIDERLELATSLRAMSAGAGAMKADDIVDVSPGAAEARLREHRAGLLIHGHTHRPAAHELEVDGAAAHRLVLGAWEEDEAARWIRMDDREWSLQEWV